MRLLTAIEGAQRRPFLVLLAGVCLEGLVMLLIGADDGIRGIRGVGGESAALLAVVGAVFAGPWAGAAMAATGWAIFFPLVAHSHVSSILALPEWTVAAYLVGALSTALVQAERERGRSELRQQAAHALRTPVATIHGLVQVLIREGRDEPVVRSIEDETERLLRSPVFERD